MDLREQRLVVVVGGVLYGVPVIQVRGAARYEALVRVPGAPPTVCGIVNIRGAVVTVLDLAVLLGVERGVPPTSIVLLEHGTRVIGLAVEAVRDVRLADPEAPDDSSLAMPHGETGHPPQVPSEVIPLDAVALCAPHLLSSEEMGL